MMTMVMVLTTTTTTTIMMVMVVMGNNGREANAESKCVSHEILHVVAKKNKKWKMISPRTGILKPVYLYGF